MENKERVLAHVCGQCEWFTPLVIKEQDYYEQVHAYDSKFGICRHDLKEKQDECDCDVCHHISEICTHLDKFLSSR